MKKALIALFIIATTSVIAQVVQSPERKYTVSLTLNQWGTYINYLEHIKGRLKQSDLPSKEVSFITDSLIVPIQQQFSDQVNAQIKADTTIKKK